MLRVEGHDEKCEAHDTLVQKEKKKPWAKPEPTLDTCTHAYLHLCSSQLAKEDLAHELSQQKNQHESLDI